MKSFHDMFLKICLCYLKVTKYNNGHVKPAKGKTTASMLPLKGEQIYLNKEIMCDNTVN